MKVLKGGETQAAATSQNASFVCLAVIITQEVTDMHHIHFDLSSFLPGRLFKLFIL